jgi:hypothetical protein
MKHMKFMKEGFPEENCSFGFSRRPFMSFMSFMVNALALRK